MEEIISQPNIDFLKLLVESLGGLKGASTLAIVAVVVQLLIKFLNLPIAGGIFGAAKGWLKLAIVTFLTIVSGVTGLMIEGLSLGAALLHSTTLAAFMVFLNQIFQHFWAKKE